MVAKVLYGINQHIRRVIALTRTQKIKKPPDSATLMLTGTKSKICTHIFSLALLRIRSYKHAGTIRLSGDVHFLEIEQLSVLLLWTVKHR